MRQRGFALIFVIIGTLTFLLLLVILSIFGKSTFNKFFNNRDLEDKFNKITSVGGLPSCPKDLSGIFTQPMVNLDSINVLTPLGNVNGTSHILPVDHVYFRVKDGVGRHQIFAPADMTIYNITLHRLEWSNQPSRSEYYYEAGICDGLNIWVAGFNELSPTLDAAFNSSKKNHEEDQTNDEKIINESARLNLEVKAGDLLGYSGGGKENPWASIEITVMNSNIKTPGVNWDYHTDRDRKSGIMCFADLYEQDLKEKHYEKFGYINDQDMFVPRTIEPRCGTIYQNISGTIQGDWFYGKPKNNENLESIGRVLAFLHLNTDPKIGVISIAGTITPRPMSVYYSPTNSGTINREPSEVKADGKIYCYSIDNQETGKGKVLAQLIDNNHLKIEYQNGDCTNTESFRDPYTFER